MTDSPSPRVTQGMSGHTMPGHQTPDGTLPVCGLYTTGLAADVMLGVKPKYPQLEPADNIT